MRELTIAVTPQVTSVYLVEVPDDFDAENPDALKDLVEKLLGEDCLLLSQNVADPTVRIESDEPITPGL
jgi:hypothetical protein